MKKKYKSIENGIEYTVIEDTSCADLVKCESGTSEIPGYIKIIIVDGRDETFYFYNDIDYKILYENKEYNFCVMHNVYGPSWSRFMCKDKYYILGREYEYKDWLIKSKKFIRRYKLSKIKKASEL